jgi:hypothetical protein
VAESGYKGNREKSKTSAGRVTGASHDDFDEYIQTFLSYDREITLKCNSMSIKGVMML